MPREERNEGCQEYHDEEWQAGDSGRMPELWHQDVQNRKELTLKKEEDVLRIIAFSSPPISRSPDRRSCLFGPVFSKVAEGRRLMMACFG
jgi:hypothetical protein